MARNTWNYTEAPPSPNVGEQWYDVGSTLLRVWTGTTWAGGIAEYGGTINGPLIVSPEGYPSSLEVRPNGWVVVGNGFQANGDVFAQNLVSNGTILAAGNISGQDLFVRDITARNGVFSGPLTLLTEAYKDTQAVTLGQVQRLIEEFYSGGADYAPLINPPNGQNNYAPLANPAFTGAASLNGDTIASQSWVNQYVTNLNFAGTFAPLVNPANGQNNYAPLNNPVFTGAIILPGDATSALQAVTLQQVQALIAAGGGAGTGYLPLTAGLTNSLTGPLHLRNLGSGSVSSSCLYFGTTLNTPYSQISQGSTNGSLDIAAGATVSDIGLWTARDQAVTGIKFQANTVDFYSDGGLTIGATYGPTTVFRYDTYRVTFNVPIAIATRAADPTPAVDGLLYYNNVNETLNFFSDGAWHILWPSVGGGAYLPLAGGTLTGQLTITNGGGLYVNSPGQGGITVNSGAIIGTGNTTITTEAWIRGSLYYFNDNNSSIAPWGYSGDYSGIRIGSNGQYVFGFFAAGNQSEVPLTLLAGNATQPLHAVPLQQVQSLIAAIPPSGGGGGTAPASWTPTITSGGSNTGITISSQTGSYTRNGYVTTATFKITFRFGGNVTTGLLLLGGLPVAGSASMDQGTFSLINNGTFVSTNLVGSLGLQVKANETNAWLVQLPWDGRPVTSIYNNTIAAGTDVTIGGTFSYITNTSAGGGGGGDGGAYLPLTGGTVTGPTIFQERLYTDHIYPTTSPGPVFMHGNGLNVAGSIFASKISIGETLTLQGINTDPTIADPNLTNGALWYDTTVGALKFRHSNIWNTVWPAAGGGGGIPEPSATGNFLRTNTGTWVAGLPISAGTANSLTGPLQLANAGSGGFGPNALLFGSTGGVPGGQIASFAPAGTTLSMAAGATTTTAGEFMARATTACGIHFQVGSMSYWVNSGLTSGSTFLPTVRLAISTNVITITTVPLVLGGINTAPTTPTNGMMYYNTSTNTINVYINGVWRTVNVT